MQPCPAAVGAKTKKLPGRRFASIAGDLPPASKADASSQSCHVRGFRHFVRARGGPLHHGLAAKALLQTRRGHGSRMSAGSGRRRTPPSPRRTRAQAPGARALCRVPMAEVVVRLQPTVLRTAASSGSRWRQGGGADDVPALAVPLLRRRPLLLHSQRGYRPSGVLLKGSY